MAIKVVVRSLEGAEFEEGVGKLRITAYPHLPEVRETEFYSSIYRWFEDHPLADQVYRWAAIAGDQLVGHLSAIPQYYRINGQRVVAHTPGDYMVHPQYGFQAISLMRRYFRATENYVSCDMVPAVIAVETRLGAEVAGKLSYAAKLLNVSRLPMPPVPGPVSRFLNFSGPNAYARECSEQQPTETETLSEAPERSAPTPRPRMPLPRPAKAILNRGLQTLDSVLGGAFGGNLKAEVIEKFDASFDELFEKVAARVPCVPEKNSAFLRWRYGPGSPQHPVTVLGVKEGETLLGYAVLKVTIGLDGYILDLVRLPERHDVARALLREAVSVFRRTETHIIRYRFNESPVSTQKRDLQCLGFFYRTMRHNTLLVNFSDADLHETARQLSNWAYTVGDGEASFWTR